MFTCGLLQVTGDLDPGQFVGLLYRDRMRTLEDKQRVTIKSTPPPTHTHKPLVYNVHVEIPTEDNNYYK